MKRDCNYGMQGKFAEYEEHRMHSWAALAIAHVAKPQDLEVVSPDPGVENFRALGGTECMLSAATCIESALGINGDISGKTAGPPGEPPGQIRVEGTFGHPVDGVGKATTAVIISAPAATHVECASGIGVRMWGM
ncbi:hypothetical protein M408DRAFT_24121 [Serendipita vermifera MAFF 305830]|uniref:Uncharacterized protein n=1 Tax=Serendipita vermifera MAFF 305830 TaxID=933852 RepID=A0A0C2XGB0_SERVB|nr:hypothetical protein M408DRAFT_24121 [Serendipita vermifera MAFF 305830]